MEEELIKRIERIEKVLQRLSPPQYTHFNGKEYMSNCFGDSYVKDEEGNWKLINK